MSLKSYWRNVPTIPRDPTHWEIDWGISITWACDLESDWRRTESFRQSIIKAAMKGPITFPTCETCFARIVLVMQDIKASIEKVAKTL